MPAFAYQALDSAGKTQRGVLQGDNARAVRANLRERGLNPLEVAAVEATSRQPGLFARGLSAAQLALLTRQLATLLKAGLPIDEALGALPAAEPRTRYFQACFSEGMAFRSTQSRAYVAAWREAEGAEVHWTMDRARIPAGAEWKAAREISGKLYRTLRGVK